MAQTVMLSLSTGIQFLESDISQINVIELNPWSSGMARSMRSHLQYVPQAVCDDVLLTFV